MLIKNKYFYRCSLLSSLNDNQLHVLAGLARQEYWTFRTEIDSSQMLGKFYLITEGRVSCFLNVDQ